MRLVIDEAEAVLAILAKKKAGQPVTEADWRRVFSSEGYVRLKARETSMKRPFEEADFRTFVLSDALAERAQALKETLARWRLADTAGAARLALAYLPKGARIRAKIYPVIKPRDNSFVFDLESDPAIFLFLDPEKSKERFENMLAHELHHIGYGTSCPPGRTSAEVAKLPGSSQLVIKLLGAFGEGFAMLAAAGGPGVHPHAYSSPDDIARWDRDAANFNDDLKRVEAFFLSILENRLTAEEIQKTSASFYGVQGPWYTVGWRMCALVEKTYGRRALVRVMCDHRRLLRAYNRAAARHNRRSRERLPLWSPRLVRAVGSK